MYFSEQRVEILDCINRALNYFLPFKDSFIIKVQLENVIKENFIENRLRPSSSVKFYKSKHWERI